MPFQLNHSIANEREIGVFIIWLVVLFSNNNFLVSVTITQHSTTHASDELNASSTMNYWQFCSLLFTSIGIRCCFHDCQPNRTFIYLHVRHELSLSFTTSLFHTLSLSRIQPHQHCQIDFKLQELKTLNDESLYWSPLDHRSGDFDSFWMREPKEWIIWNEILIFFELRPQRTNSETQLNGLVEITNGVTELEMF